MPVEKSQIRVNSIVSNDTPAGPVIVSYGASIPSGKTFTAQGNVNIVGVVTASSFVGDGSGLTGLNIASQGYAIALTYLL